MKKLLAYFRCWLPRLLHPVRFDAVRHVELVCYGSTWSTEYHLMATLQLSTSGSVKNLRPSENG